MRRFRSSFALLSLVFPLAACGAEVEPSAPASGAPESGGAPTGSQDTPPSETNEGTQETSIVGPLVRPRNTSEAPRWIVVDGQSTPVDFKIGEPPMQLNGYGSYWCGGPTWNHNDPFSRVVKVEPGALADTYWRAISVTREGDCWRGTPLAPGSYPTKACFYESEPTETSTLTCVDTTLTITSPDASAEIPFSAPGDMEIWLALPTTAKERPSAPPPASPRPHPRGYDRLKVRGVAPNRGAGGGS
jgi:hypothetical protein